MSRIEGDEAVVEDLAAKLAEMAAHLAASRKELELCKRDLQTCRRALEAYKRDLEIRQDASDYLQNRYLEVCKEITACKQELARILLSPLPTAQGPSAEWRKERESMIERSTRLLDQEKELLAENARLRRELERLKR
jgi:hypothetical protein